MIYTGYGILVPIIWILAFLACTADLSFPIHLPLQMLYTPTRLGIGLVACSVFIFGLGKWLNRDKTPYERDFFGKKKIVSGGRHSFQLVAFEHWGWITLALGLAIKAIQHFK